MQFYLSDAQRRARARRNWEIYRTRSGIAGAVARYNRRRRLRLRFRLVANQALVNARRNRWMRNLARSNAYPVFRNWRDTR